MTERTITAGAIVRLVPPLSSPLMFVDSLCNPQVTVRVGGASGTIDAGPTWVVCRWWTELHGMQEARIPLHALKIEATAAEVADAIAKRIV